MKYTIATIVIVFAAAVGYATWHHFAGDKPSATVGSKERETISGTETLRVSPALTHPVTATVPALAGQSGADGDSASLAENGTYDFTKLTDAAKQLGPIFDQETIRTDWAATSDYVVTTTIKAKVILKVPSALSVECRETLCKVDIKVVGGQSSDEAAAAREQWVSTIDGLLGSAEWADRFDNAVVLGVASREGAGEVLRTYLHRKSS